MSLNQLPNDLITHIGSFLSFEDNIQFGLCQKRIHSVLKRDGHDKPNCETLEFTNVAHPRGYFMLPDWSEFPIEQETRDPKFNSAVGQIINKFRKVKFIYFYGVLENVTEDVFKDLLKTKTKLSSLKMFAVEVVAVDPNIFIAACNKFDKIELESPILPTELLCDQVFVELMPIMTFSLCTREFVYGPFDGYSLTDKTLKALTVPGVKKRFDIGGIFTSFTIAGIKNLVEEVLKAKERNVIYDLGILKFSEGRTVVHWMEEIAADHNCPYIIRRDDLVRETFPYTINMKNNTLGPFWRIEFAINQVEV